MAQYRQGIVAAWKELLQDQTCSPRCQISQAAHVIELFHGSRKVVFVEDWISSELDLEYKSMKATRPRTKANVSPVSKGKDLRTVSGRDRGTDSFPQGGLE